MVVLRPDKHSGFGLWSRHRQMGNWDKIGSRSETYPMVACSRDSESQLGHFALGRSLTENGARVNLSEWFRLLRYYWVTCLAISSEKI